MRWKMKPKPKVGDIKIFEKFCWLPKILRQGEEETIVWLEKLILKQQYTPCLTDWLGDDYKNKWITLGYFDYEKTKKLLQNTDVKN